MRQFAIIRTQDFVYLRLQALVWAEPSTSSPSTVTQPVGNILGQVIAQQSTDLPLVINCFGISCIHDRSMAAVSSEIECSAVPLIFLGADGINDQLRSGMCDRPPDATYKSLAYGLLAVYQKGDQSSAQAEHWCKEALEAEQKHIERIVRNSYKAFDEGMSRLASTPLLASGIFNARGLISNPIAFTWISLLMAQKLDEVAKQTAPSRLLAVSLRGSPFAAALGFLSSITFEIVDHVGPRQKILEEYSVKPYVRGTPYIYVGDFVIGGTELKVAEMYAATKGCPLKHAIVIGSLLSPQDYGQAAGNSGAANLHVHPLVNLQHICPNAKYELFKNT
jgi:hypothetical protein